MQPDYPHFDYPFVRGADGRPKMVEQDTEEHVVACENLIVRCPQGFRDDRPEFGIVWPEYRTLVDPAEIETDLQRFEPRSNLTAVEARSLLDSSETDITVYVEVQT